MYSEKETAIVVDLDGTIRNGAHRLHLIPTKDIADNARSWDKFNLACGGDTPIPETVELVNAMVERGHRVLFVSGCSEIAYHITIKWLEKCFDWFDRDNDEVLLMRDYDDHGSPSESKLHKIKILSEQYDILFAIDDDKKIVSGLREMGISAFHVFDWQDSPKCNINPD